MIRITNGLLLCGLLLGCGSPWDELFSGPSSAGLTMYRVNQANTDSSVLLAVETAPTSRALASQPDCIRLSAQVGSVEPISPTTMGTMTAHELYMQLPLSFPHRALAFYRQNTAAAGKPNVVLGELLITSACNGQAEMVPVARAVLAIDLTANKTTGSQPSQDMAITDISQVRN